jgi:hypothetical protein
MYRTLVAAVLLLSAACAAPAAGAQDVAARIITMERAALDRSDRGDAEGFLEISASNIVYLDPSLNKPIDGLAELTAYYRNFQGGDTGAAGEMTNPKVQVLGDVAVLTFHYIVRRQNAVVREWNATEVYRRSGQDWRIVNTHWSLTKPLPQPLPK